MTKTGELGFLTGLFEQDIRTGDKAFDKAFQVQGEPEDAVRRLLSSSTTPACSGRCRRPR